MIVMFEVAGFELRIIIEMLAVIKMGMIVKCYAVSG